MNPEIPTPSNTTQPQKNSRLREYMKWFGSLSHGLQILCCGLALCLLLAGTSISFFLVHRLQPSSTSSSQQKQHTTTITSSQSRNALQPRVSEPTTTKPASSANSTVTNQKSNTTVPVSTTTKTKNTQSTANTSGSSNSGSGNTNSGGSHSSGGSTVKEDIITTLYAYPTLPIWSDVTSASPTVKYAIVNICAPDGTGSGCGSPADESNPDWPHTITDLENAGITPLYYISTNYGAIALSVIEGEIQNAVTWYGTPSPMFDTVSVGSTCSNGGSPISCESYYADLYNYAVNAGATAVEFNPGVIPPSTYMFGSKEIMQVFEGTAADFESTSFPSWMTNYSVSEFAADLSVGSSATIGSDVTDAVNDHIGNFYEDDEAEPPNYSTIPAFWATELNDVANAQ